MLLKIILNQNYFSFQGQIYQPNKGESMGSPISGTMAEIFLQHLEHTHVKHLIESNILSFYTRYVDDILIIYDSTLTTSHNTPAQSAGLNLNPTLSRPRTSKHPHPHPHNDPKLPHPRHSPPHTAPPLIDFLTTKTLNAYTHTHTHNDHTIQLRPP